MNRRLFRFWRAVGEPADVWYNRDVNKLVRPLAGVGIALIAALITMIADFVFQDQSQELRKSLRVLAHRRLEASYEVRRESLSGAHETDASASWALDLATTPADYATWLKPHGFAKSNDDENDEFRRQLEADESVTLPPAYRSYEARMALGKGTICESLPCDIVVLAAPGNPRIFVMIWKI